MRLEVWSDIVCPWCYVGKRRLERALAAFPHRADVTIVHRAFILYQAFPRGQAFDRRDMLMRKYGLTLARADAMNADMERTAAADGLDYHLAGGLTGNTFDAHQLVVLARSAGLEERVLERLYRAFFTEQRSVFDRKALTAIGVDVGLDEAGTASALERDACGAQVEADLDQARAIQVEGVPFFLFDGRYALAGAQPVDVFRRALAEVWAAGEALKPPREP